MKFHKKRGAIILLSSQLICFLAADRHAFAQTPTGAPAPVNTGSVPSLTLPSAEECLTRVRGFEPTLLNLRETAKSAISAIIPDPVAYEKTLPPIEKVISDKDAKNLRNFGGLSEAYYFAGNAAKGKELFAKFESGAKTLIDSSDPFPGLVKGDIGLYYFFEKNYDDAEKYISDALARIEPHMTMANSNNILSSYMTLTLIYDKAGKREKALEYAKKAVALAIKQRQEPIK